MFGVPSGAKESSGDRRLTLPVSVSWSWEAAAPLNHTPIPPFGHVPIIHTRSISFMCMTYLAFIGLLDMQLLF